MTIHVSAADVSTSPSSATAPSARAAGFSMEGGVQEPAVTAETTKKQRRRKRLGCRRRRRLQAADAADVVAADKIVPETVCATAADDGDCSTGNDPSSAAYLQPKIPLHTAVVSSAGGDTGQPRSLPAGSVDGSTAPKTPSDQLAAKLEWIATLSDVEEDSEVQQEGLVAKKKGGSGQSVGAAAGKKGKRSSSSKRRARREGSTPSSESVQYPPAATSSAPVAAQPTKTKNVSLSGIAPSLQEAAPRALHSMGGVDVQLLGRYVAAGRQAGYEVFVTKEVKRKIFRCRRR